MWLHFGQLLENVLATFYSTFGNTVLTIYVDSDSWIGKQALLIQKDYVTLNVKSFLALKDSFKQMTICQNGTIEFSNTLVRFMEEH